MRPPLTHQLGASRSRWYWIISPAVVAIAAASLAGCNSSNGTATSTQSPAAASATGGSAATTAAASGVGGPRPTCPSASSVSTVTGNTYSGPQSQAGPGSGTTVCNYLAGTVTGLTLTYYPAGTPLSVITAGASGPLSPLSSSGTEETNASGQIDYVSRNLQPSIIVDDHTDAQGLAPTQLTQLLELQ